MGRRLHITRVIVRLCVSYLAILTVLLLGLDAAAYAYIDRTQHDVLEPVLGLPEGQAAYAEQMRRTALGLALLDVPLLIVAGAASYVLATLSVRPLIAAREREAQFSAEAAHELRTPLARIAGLAQSARGHDDDPRDEALERIERLALDAAATTGDLLALVREERVAPRLAEPVDLAALVRDVAGGARREGIAYELALEENCWIVGDERRVRRLAENLIQNALRHARSRVRLRVGAEGTKIVLAVEDDGAGVPADLRDRLFERFVRGDDDEHGSGLGLAICRSIARAHGGDVVLEERSRFVARLPRLDVKGV
ncbi:MAG TPA: HAMP domain-containing sensor histidine kinase [Candidatus Acidoferrum sp.]|nr:HAMP domain-containing sensor histidine kinase [Candidatus Acidoferrum sp.]